MKPQQCAPRAKKLLWRSRRGTKELDLILSRFIHNHYAALSNAEQRQFEALLEVSDPQLTDWLCYHTTPTTEGMANIVNRILSTH